MIFKDVSMPCCGHSARATSPEPLLLSTISWKRYGVTLRRMLSSSVVSGQSSAGAVSQEYMALGRRFSRYGMTLEVNADAL